MKISATKVAAGKTPPQKIIVIYHGDCADGFGGAYAAWKKFKNKAAYFPAHDRFALPYPIKNKEVYLIDYTYQEDVIKKLMHDNMRVTAIDHHVSLEAAAKLTKDYSFALNHSGAVLAWHYFHPGKKVPLFLRYIEDRDLWKWTIPFAREILTYVNMFDHDFSLWDRLAHDLEKPDQRKKYKEKGALLLAYEKSMMEDILPGAERVEFAGHTIYAINTPHHFVSDLGNILANKTKSFSILWREYAGVIKVSLRSNGSVDVAKIAERYNGGGHKSAAAFSFPVGTKIPWNVINDGK